jgi:hypothetical protein
VTEETDLNNTKFTMNALLVIVTIFSAIGLLFTVGIYKMGQHAYLVSDYEAIEGTDLAIRYSTKEPSGIYRGTKYADELVLEGEFGYDKGTTYSEGKLYLNEYRYTDTGFTLCDVVCVDTESFEKTVLMENAMLRGHCESGELVCRGDCFPRSDMPDTNSLCRFYAMTSPKLDPSSGSATVTFIDPASGEIVYTARDDAQEGDFDEHWLPHTLEEVRK